MLTTPDLFFEQIDNVDDWSEKSTGTVEEKSKDLTWFLRRLTILTTPEELTWFLRRSTMLTTPEELMVDNVDDPRRADLVFEQVDNVDDP